MNKKEAHVVTGMVRDMSAAKFNPNFVFDARNIRITARGKLNSLLAVTNEKGTEEITVTGDILYGLVIGSAVFPDVVVLFTTERVDNTNRDRIYRLTFNADGSVVSKNMTKQTERTPDYLNLGFDAKHPLETYPLYETSEIKKVYWVDGVNQPRVINICDESVRSADSFNFVREVNTDATISITKRNSGGEFPSGMIQYCFAYFNKFSQQTAIVDYSPMYYLSPMDRGLPADGISTASFEISLTNLDYNFKYVRIYAILSTSENSVQSVRIVGDYEIQREVSIDTNSIDEASLIYVPDTSSHQGVGPYDLCVISITTGEVQYSIANVFDSLPDGPAWTGITDIKEFPTQSDLRLCSSAVDGVLILTAKEHINTIIQNDVWEEPLLIARRNGSFYVLAPEYDDQVEDNYILTTASLLQGSAKKVVTVDTGMGGIALDSTALLFLGGTPIVPSTLAVKDNTMFLGNIKESSTPLGTLEIGNGQTLSQYARSIPVECSRLYRDRLVNSDAFYDYYIDNNRSNSHMTTFKAGENYRLGFVAQDIRGKWSDVIWLGDYTESLRADSSLIFSFSDYRQNIGTTKTGFAATIPASIVSIMYESGYRKIAPVVVYPKGSDRIVMCQGILSGTIYNVKDRQEGFPFVQADWRFRDGYSWQRIDDEIQLNSNQTYVGFVGNFPDNYTEKTYVLAPRYPGFSLDASVNGNVIDPDFSRIYGTYYYRDPTILTLHSPDIEVNDGQIENFENTSLYIVGISSDRNFFTPPNTVAVMPPQKEVAMRLSGASGGRATNSSIINEIEQRNKDSLLFSGFYDIPYNNGFNTDSQFQNRYFKWATYLWHRHGSLNNYNGVDRATVASFTNEVNGTTAELKTKCISEISYARTTFFNSVSKDINIPIATPKLCTKDTPMVQLDYLGEKVSYFGNIDKILFGNFEKITFAGTNHTWTVTDSLENTEGIQDLGYPIYATGNGALISKDVVGKNYSQYNTLYYTAFAKDPVVIKYNSTNHVVIPLSSEPSIKSLGESIVNSTVYFGTSQDDNKRYLFWTHNTEKAISKVEVKTKINENTEDEAEAVFDNCIYIAELRRNMDSKRMESRFGGTSKEALAMNDWFRCGEARVLNSGYATTIIFTEGDTYIGRYDCLKTYPTTQQDENSIVSIYSTELESRVNLDLRYDRNRGLKDNTLVTPENFNLFNRPGYEQTNRYFTYHSLDYDKFNTTHFPNMITWSLEKTLGEEIDTWTEMSLMSTFDMEGSLGEITKLATFGNELFGFQQNGIAQVLYNSRVQIPTSDGQPIEITNGLKYGGLRYITKTVGLTNKWSMVESPLGLYFVDDNSNTLYRFTGQLNDISTTEGFNTWLSEVCSHKVWNPEEFENIKSFYDRTNKDVYFVTKDLALVYSESLNKFTSFMDYSKVSEMFSIGNKYFALRNTDTKLWRLWEGEYNSFFGVIKPYWLTFISNDGQITDKVYDTLEWRAQFYNNMSGNTSTSGVIDSLPFNTFDTLRVWNDHQDSLETPLVTAAGKSYNLRKKFNVFRALVPRDKSSQYAPYNRDRIRNPWTYIQLKKSFPSTELMVFNDFVVNYFE